MLNIWQHTFPFSVSSILPVNLSVQLFQSLYWGSATRQSLFISTPASQGMPCAEQSSFFRAISRASGLGRSEGSNRCCQKSRNQPSCDRLKVHISASLSHSEKGFTPVLCTSASLNKQDVSCTLSEVRTSSYSPVYKESLQALEKTVQSSPVLGWMNFNLGRRGIDPGRVKK